MQQDLIGSVVDGRYRIERIVGRGGMGTVYACRHVVVGKSFAMKVLRSGIERSEEVLQRFIREAQAANSVKSRHICEMSDFGQLPNGAFFVVMELLDGTSLTRFLRDQAPNRRALKHVFVQIAETLQRAHDQQIVHRDLKPDNVVLVNDDGDPMFVKLVDFGIAKMMQQDASNLTETGIILGTPYYMSPEQARGDALDHRSDIYALGVMMYRAFTGKLPFIADTAMGVLTRHLTEKPQLPSQLAEMDLATERLILRCLEKRPIDRFQSMSEVAAAIRSIPDELPPPNPRAANGSERSRQVTPTRIDTPRARLSADGSPIVGQTATDPLVGALPMSIAPESVDPKSTDPTPLVASRSPRPSWPGTPSPALGQPAPQRPSSFASPTPDDPRMRAPSYPGTQTSSPGISGAHPYAAASYPQSIPSSPHGVSGAYPNAQGQHSGGGLGMPSRSQSFPPSPVYAPSTSGDDAQPYWPGEPALAPHLQGEAHTNRGLVSTRMAAKAASTTQRFALGVGAFLFVLVGVVLGILVLRSGTGSATRPTPAVTTSDAVGTAGPRSDDGDPVPIASTVSANSAEPVAPASANPSPSSRAPGSTGINAPTTNGNGGPNNGASTNPQVNPARPVKPHGDEIRSPFE